jgi:zinc/manganese transport system substrate-binding protein
MKSLLLIICIAIVCFAEKKLEVVASVPDLADMAKQIGGDAVHVVTLATGREDLHSVPARPSFIPKLNKADVLLTLGLGAEHAWLPSIAAESRNPKIREDGPGWIDCYKGIAVLGVPQKLDRSEGEQHPDGNPHYNIGPQCGKIMASNIERAFSTAMPSMAAYFHQRAEDYRKVINELTVKLQQDGSRFQGISVIEYHPDIAYFADFYGLKIIGSIEPKAGVAPTANHLKSLENKANDTNVKCIIYNQSQNNRIPEKLAHSLNCKTVQIANAVGAQPEITTWVELQQYNFRQLKNALHGEIK